MQKERAVVKEGRVIVNKRKRDMDQKEIEMVVKLEEEKKLRFSQEKKIVTRMEKEGCVVLEGGGVLCTPSQVETELRVRDVELARSLEESKSQDVAAEKSLPY